MSLTAEQSYILSRKYVQATADALGAVKGAPCQIQSIVDNPDGTHTITFSWESKSGVVQTDSMIVADGADGADGAEGPKGDTGDDGRGIDHALIVDNHLIIYYDDGTNEDAGYVGGGAGAGVPTGGTTGQVLAKKSDSDYDTEWVDNEGDVDELTNEQVNSLISILD